MMILRTSIFLGNSGRIFFLQLNELLDGSICIRNKLLKFKDPIIVADQLRYIGIHIRHSTKDKLMTLASVLLLSGCLAFGV